MTEEIQCSGSQPCEHNKIIDWYQFGYKQCERCGMIWPYTVSGRRLLQ